MSVHSDAAPITEPTAAPLSAKFVIAGGFAVGKTTFVSAVSEVKPFLTEEAMTEASAGVDDLTHTEAKTTTTVAMDFGRITIHATLVLYLLGTPGQDRFGFMWDDLVEGALGALVLVDTRRLPECYPAVDYFEERSIPFIVVVNQFDGAPVHDVDEVRATLNVGEGVPLVSCDARDRESVKSAILSLLDHLLTRMG